MLLITFIVDASANVFHCCFRWYFKLFFYKIVFFSAQLVSAQRLPALFLFEIFVPLLVI